MNTQIGRLAYQMEEGYHEMVEFQKKYPLVMPSKVKEMIEEMKWEDSQFKSYFNQFTGRKIYVPLLEENGTIDSFSHLTEDGPVFDVVLESGNSVCLECGAFNLL